MDSAVVKNSLRAKFPEYPERPLPDTATKGQLVDNLDGLRDLFLNLELGSAPGAGRMRPEYLITLGREIGREDMEKLLEHSLNTLNGTYPPWFHRAAGAFITVPLFKTTQKQDTVLRPLGLASSMVQVLERIQSSLNRPALQYYLEP